jgi:dihydropyrimidinase
MLVSNPSPAVLDEFPTIRARGISSLKIYMTYAALQLRDNQILDVLLASRRAGITTMIHAENGDVLTWMTAQLESRGLIAPKYHATSRPQIVETEATNRAISLSEIIDAPLLIVHVSSPSAAAHIRAAQTRGLPIYAETCPQYLFLTREDLSPATPETDPFSGAKCVCSPPPRDSASDHTAIWQGLRNGTFTILSSDHCPFTYDDVTAGKKSILSPSLPVGKFSGIPNGLPGIETRLPLTLTHAAANRLPVQKFVELTSTNPAKLYGMYPRKGALVPGISDADLVVWYPPAAGGKNKGVKTMEPFHLTNEMLHHACDYTPFEGRRVEQWPRWTILRGRIVWDREGEGIVAPKGYGVFIERGQSSLAASSRGESDADWDVSVF